MSSSSFAEIQGQLRRYVAGELKLDEFRNWCTPATWGIDDSDDAASRDLSYEIEDRLAEFTHGDWDEQELKALLRPLARRRAVSA